VAFARTFTQRAAAALLFPVAMAMALGGLALAGLGMTLRQNDVGIEGMAIVTGGLMALGVALALPGGVSVVWARVSGYSSDRLISSSGSLFTLMLGAAVIPLALAATLGPLTGYWRDVLRLAAEYEVSEALNGPSALVFVPAIGVLLVPILEAAAAILVGLSCILLILLLAVRSAEAPRLTTIAAILLIGLVAGSWIGVATTARLAPVLEQVIRDTPDPGGLEQARARALLTRHRGVGADSAWMLSWATAAMVLLALAARTLTASVPAPDPMASPLHGLDDATRAQALLDAADHLHRTTTPRRY
jgi:hypothetical protein